MKSSIVFFSSTDFGASILDELIDKDYDIQAVVTRSDKRKGRGKKMQTTPVKELALKHHIPVLEYDKANDALKEELDQLRPDFFVVVAYGAILGKGILTIPSIAPVNIHASLLPTLRGASPIESAIKNGLHKTGVSFMKMNEKLDEGDVYRSLSCEIKENETFDSLNAKLLDLSKSHIDTVLMEIKSGLKPQPQLGESSYASKIMKSDEFIDFSKSAKEVKNLINSLDSHIGATAIKNGERYKLYGASISDKKLEPGEILASKESILIGTATEAISVQSVKAQGKKKMNVKSFLLGNKLEGEFELA